MRHGDIYRSIGFRPVRRSCTMKRAYSYKDAARAVSEHNRRLVCGDMQAYWCRHHRAWLIGHSNRHRLT